MRCYLFILTFLLCAVSSNAEPLKTKQKEPLRTKEGWVLPNPIVVKPFLLSDHNAKQFNLERLKGQWTIASLGYMRCSDICPTTLATLRGVKNQLSMSGSSFQYLFISVDPFRDTLASLKEHMAYFDPKFIGVTGQYQELARFVGSLGARYDYRDKETRKMFKGKARPGVDDYTVGHTADLFIFDPDGRLVGFVFPPHDVEKTVNMVLKIQTHYKNGKSVALATHESHEPQESQ